jgi:hypothetical protein
LTSDILIPRDSRFRKDGAAAGVYFEISFRVAEAAKD